MHYTGNKIVICQLQNTLSNFLKFCKVCARQKSKNECSTFIYKFSRNLCFSSKFKNCFQAPFITKVVVTKKNTLHALNPLLTHTNKPTSFSCRFVKSMYYLFYHRALKGS